ncbi:GGDEF domain-containing phosphodiesterase [Pseudoalteromonas mariniglutinosa]
MHFINRFFLLNEQCSTDNKIPNWRISSLRIILTSAMLLCLLVVIHTFNDARIFNLFYVTALSVGFFVATSLLLIASRHYYRICSHGLLVSIVAASAAINLFIVDHELAKVGSMYMYSCPLIALMLLGFRVALGYAILNIVPFYMIINNVELSSLTRVSTQLPSADWYITGLIFLFFNICIPLAVARTIVAAKRLNKVIFHANTQLKAKNDIYRTFFSESNKAKLIVNQAGFVTDLNKRALAVFGLHKQVKNNRYRLHDLLPQLNGKDALNQEQVINFNNTYQRVISRPTNDADYRVYEFFDCTQEQLIKKNLAAMELENKALRYRDNDTRLPNRKWFELQCQRLTTKYQQGFYIVVTQSANSDYVHLKFTKHNAKAQIMTAFKRLKSNPKGALLCAHVGRGKLAFIAGAKSQDELNKLLYNIKDTLDEAYHLLGKKCSQSYLFGVAHFPEHGNDCPQLLSHATQALKKAHNADPIGYYNKANSQEFLKKYEISMLLDEALQQAELNVDYQPKVTKDGNCIGLEALARWHSPILGVVPPATFVPIAEQYQLINRLTDLIIQKVCAQLEEWAHTGLDVPPVAINISLRDFSQTNFMSKLVKYLADFNVKPAQIELELTETSLEANQAHSLKLMKTLQAWGFIISVDDFGVGYSNIARLAEYPINKLKLDRSLISKITHSSRQQSLVKAVHAMCHELNINCVAEGIETYEQVVIMAEMGCKEFQGFFFAKPMTADAYSQHVKQYGQTFNPQSRVTSVP